MRKTLELDFVWEDSLQYVGYTISIQEIKLQLLTGTIWELPNTVDEELLISTTRIVPCYKPLEDECSVTNTRTTPAECISF